MNRHHTGPGSGGGGGGAGNHTSELPSLNVLDNQTAGAGGAGAGAGAAVGGGGTSSKQMTWTELGIELITLTVAYTVTYFVSKQILKYLDPTGYGVNGSGMKVDPTSKKKLEDKVKKQVSINEYEAIISSQIIYQEDIDVCFDDIGGLEREKQEIHDIVALPLKRPDLFAKSGTKLVSAPKGILLYGPPGTGKTMMAKAIAKESGASFINFSTATTQNKWFGETEKLIQATFSLARKLAPCIIFIDEIDAFLRERTSSDPHPSATVKAEFMSLWDGLTTDQAMLSQEGSRPAYGVIIIGATNRPWDVDAAILRRMPRTFELKLPDPSQRLSIMRLFLKDVTLSSELSRLLPEFCKIQLEGYSGSDMKELCRAAVMVPFKEFVARNANKSAEDDEMRPLELNDLVLALNDVMPTGIAAKDYQGRSEMGRNEHSRNGGGVHEIQQAYLLGLQHSTLLLQQQQQQQQQQYNGVNKPVNGTSKSRYENLD